MRDRPSAGALPLLSRGGTCNAPSSPPPFFLFPPGAAGREGGGVCLRLSPVASEAADSLLALLLWQEHPNELYFSFIFIPVCLKIDSATLHRSLGGGRRDGRRMLGRKDIFLK